jgi:hypothetical protein
MMPREMTPMYIPDDDFQAPKVDELLPHFLVLHKMMRKTLAPRIGYSKAILTYEQNLLDALMKLVHFDIFEYIIDEIWNITTNLARSCGFDPFIQYMIEVVAYEKFYKDVKHASLRPPVPKHPRTHRSSSSTPTVAPARTTHNGGDSSSSSQSSEMLKMSRGIFAMYRRTDQHLDVIEQRMEIVHRNQEIIHSQRDEPLLEFLDVPVYPPITDPYASPTPTEFFAFGVGPSYAPTGSDDDDEDDEIANDEEETEDEEETKDDKEIEDDE